MLAACGFQTYSAKPISPAQSAASYRSHDPNSEAFRAYLIAQGYQTDQLPIKQWGTRELTLCSLFFHPDLDVARAQWRSAQAEEITAGQRPDLGVSGRLENHSDTSGGRPPWTYGLAIDIPIATANKSQAKKDRASSLSEAARLEIAQTAWQVRSRLLASLSDYYASLQQAQILQQELNLRNEIVAILDARLDAGLISNVEASNARLLRQKTRLLLDAENGRLPELSSVIANNAGLSAAVFKQLDLANPVKPSALPTISSEQAQEDALLNRLDIRAALARYAAAEAKLHLEIARQYPDITLSPGFSYDQGDRLWSLGISTLLTLINKNKGLIEESKALREVEAAQFEALQAKVIGDLEQARARYQAAMDDLDKARQLQINQQASLKEAGKQFDVGYADRLDLTTAKLENLLAEQSVLNTELKLQRAVSALENIMQRPLDGNLAMPSNIEQAVRAKEQAPERP